MTLVSDTVAERLLAWGVRRVFGYPGTGADALLEAFRRAGAPEFVQARHAASAAFMACGHAKATGTVGCCLAPVGASTWQLVSGLYDARLDRQPVVALLATEGGTGAGTPLQEGLRPERLVAALTPHCAPAGEPPRVPDVLDRAFRTALTHRTVAAVLLPAGVPDTDVRRTRSVPEPGAPGPADGAVPALLPDAEALRRAADVLGRGERVAVLVGQGARPAAEEIVRVADVLGAGVAKTVLGRDVLPDELPFVTGTAGPTGSPASARMLRACDTLLAVGTTSHGDPRDGAPRPRRVEVRADDAAPGPADSPDVALVGDVRATLDALLPLLHRTGRRGWRTRIEKGVRAWHRDRRADARQHFGHLINPASVAEHLSDRLPDRAVLVADAGTSAGCWARNLLLRTDMRAIASGGSVMGTGVPYALAARLAHPDRPVIALVGDGAFQMNGLAELVTVKDHLDRLTGTPPLVLCVLNNRDLNRATWDRRTETGRPRLRGTASVPDVPYAAHARLLGLEGIRCVRPKNIRRAWDAALAAERPVVLEFVVDAETPPIPAPAAGRLGTAPRRATRALLRRG